MFILKIALSTWAVLMVCGECPEDKKVVLNSSEQDFFDFTGNSDCLKGNAGCSISKDETEKLDIKAKLSGDGFTIDLLSFEASGSKSTIRIVYEGVQPPPEDDGTQLGPPQSREMPINPENEMKLYEFVNTDTSSRVIITLEAGGNGMQLKDLELSGCRVD